MATPNPLEALAGALREAVDECRAHNEDYHHRTPDERFDEWERILGVATSGSVPPELRQPDPEG